MKFGKLAKSSAFSQGDRRGNKFGNPNFGRAGHLLLVKLGSLVFRKLSFSKKSQSSCEAGH